MRYKQHWDKSGSEAGRSRRPSLFNPRLLRRVSPSASIQEVDYRPRPLRCFEKIVSRRLERVF